MAGRRRLFSFSFSLILVVAQEKRMMMIDCRPFFDSEA